MADEEKISKDEHLKRINAKQAKIEELQTALKTANQATADLTAQLQKVDPDKWERRIGRLVEERDTARNELSEFKAQTATKETMLTAGITDADDRDLVMWRYGRLDEKGRPDLADWLKESAKEDRHLSHLFNSEEPAKPAKPNTNGHTRPSAKPPASASLEAVLAMGVEERNSPEGRKLVAEALRSAR